MKIKLLFNRHFWKRQWHHFCQRNQHRRVMNLVLHEYSKHPVFFSQLSRAHINPQNWDAEANDYNHKVLIFDKDKIDNCFILDWNYVLHRGWED